LRTVIYDDWGFMNTLEKKVTFCGEIYWHNPETGVEYARVAAGVQFPGKKQGFACVLGETEARDAAGLSRNFHLLAEIEEAGLQTFIERVNELKQIFSIVDIYGDPNDRTAQEFLYAFNLELRERRQRGFYLSRPPLLGEKGQFEYCCQVIFKHVRAGRKTLHFGPASKLPAYLLEFGQEHIRSGRPDDFPAIAALGYVLTALDIWQAWKPDTRIRAAADYDPFDSSFWDRQPSEYDIFK